MASIKGADERPGAFTINSQAPLSEPTVDSYRFLAEQIAADAVKQLNVLLGCDPATADEASCVSAFITSFGLRTYRRPLNADEVAR